VVKAVLRLNAAAVIFGHCHPGPSPAICPADRRRRLFHRDDDGIRGKRLLDREGARGA